MILKVIINSNDIINSIVCLTDQPITEEFVNSLILILSEVPLM